MSSAVRPSTPEDGPAIIALLAAAGLAANVGPRELEWKYWQERTDWPGPRSFVLTKDGEILAHAAMVPGVLAWQAERARALHLIDWGARRSASGAGVSLMKYIGRQADVLLAIGGSAQTLQILPHVGFRPCGTTTSLVHTLHPLRLLKTGVARGWKRLPRVARSIWWAT